LHAGLAILDDGDAEADEFFVLLGQGAIGVGRPLHGNEAVVDLGGVGQQFVVGTLALERNLLELIHA
jgi:hypothetical protein